MVLGRDQQLRLFDVASRTQLGEAIDVGSSDGAALRPDGLEMARTVATARLLLGEEMNIQAPPNLSPHDHRLLLRSGINDWGGISPVTQDYINPEAAWPQIDLLAKTCRDEGFILRERLAIYQEYIAKPQFLEPALKPLTSELQAAIA